MEAIESIEKQYYHFKSKQQDSILLLRNREQYTTFGDDAAICSKILGLGLGILGTVSHLNIPTVDIMAYLTELARAGHKISVIERLEGNTRGYTKKDVILIHRDAKGAI